MKKSVILGSAAAVLVAVLMSGCSSKEAKPKEDFACKQEGALAPEWTCIPHIEGGIAELGIAQQNAGRDYGFQRTEAMANARAALARQLEVKVKDMVKSWTRATGAGVNQSFEKNVETVTKQLSNQTLVGSKQVKAWSHPKTGTLFVLVAISDKNVAKDIAKQAVKTSLRNEEALWQQFQHKKAQEELDKEFEKQFQ